MNALRISNTIFLRRGVGHRPSSSVTPFIITPRRSHSTSLSTFTSPHLSVTKSPTNPTILIVRFTEPKTMNALTESMGKDFENLMTKVIPLEKDIRCLVLTGASNDYPTRAFSSGGNLNFLRDRITSTPLENTQIMRQFYKMFLSVRQVSVPTIAAINGHAVGAGFCLALACDIRVANANAKMGLNFVKLGLSPGMAGSYFLPRIAGQQVASRLIFTGELVSGTEAEKLGLVLEAVKEDSNGNESKTLSRALEIAASIAENSPVALRAVTRTMRMQQDKDLDGVLQREADTQAHCYAMGDYKEGLDAIVEKRKGVF